jgi:hypothetical protein
VGLEMKPVGEPYAGNPHVRFDERGGETERWPHGPQATAPLLDSTFWTEEAWGSGQADGRSEYDIHVAQRTATLGSH